MTLVEAVATNYEPYALDLAYEPGAIRSGAPAVIRFRVREPETRAVVTAFEEVHERLFHLFVVSSDLQQFQHLHPARVAENWFEVTMTLPAPGAYRLVADFFPAGAAPQLVQRTIVTAGYEGFLGGSATLAPNLAEQMVNGTLVRLTMPDPVAGREQLVTFDLRDERTGAAVTDLQPYLGATGHVLMMSADLEVAFHRHPAVLLTSSFGPTVVFQVLFPRPGAYRIWAQFQRHGQVFTVPYSVVVSARS